MEANLSVVDRVVRVGLGVILAGIGLFVVKGILGVALALVGGVLVFSGTVGFCHVYKFFGICSLPKKP